jgi:Putative prokaryotic signal transducing protein
VSHLVELVRSNDLAHLSWAEAMLTAAGIACVLADAHVSSIEGNIGAFPRRLLVAADDLEPARRVLAQAASATLDDHQ